MANSPHPETVTVSFTLPRQLSEAVNALAKRSMTNKSDIIRRAIMAYLPAEQSAQIVQDVAGVYAVDESKSTINNTPRN